MFQEISRTNKSKALSKQDWLRSLPSQCIQAGFPVLQLVSTVCLTLSLCIPEKDKRTLSSLHPPVRQIQILLWSPLILLFWWQSKPSSQLPNCFHHQSLWYVHVSSVLWSSELHKVLWMHLSSLRREKEASPWIFWLHSWMLQELLTHVHLTCLWGLPAPFLQFHVLASWTLTRVVAQGYSLSDAELLLDAVRDILVTRVQYELQVLFSLTETAA